MASLADFKLLIPDPAAPLCAMFKKWIKLPLTIYNWLVNVADSEGNILGVMKVGECKISFTPLLEDDYWKLCNGQSLPQASYPLLWNAFGMTDLFGDPKSPSATNFSLPDLRGRFPMQCGMLGDSAGTSVNLGSKGGEAEHTLVVGEMPAHHHHVIIKANAIGADGSGALCGGLELAAGDSRIPDGTDAEDTEDTGDGGPHNNIPPYLGCYIYIRVK